MPVFQYGATQIEWVFKCDRKLAYHYATVERGKKVVLKGPEASLKNRNNSFVIVRAGLSNGWQHETGLEALLIKIKHFESRWANCTKNQVLEFHPRCMEFSNAVMDYIVIHELTKRFLS